MHHNLKIWPDYFMAVANGLKKFEIRKNDRAYQIGDTFTLQEFDPATGEYGSELGPMTITYIIYGTPFLPPQMCAFGWEDTEHYP